MKHRGLASRVGEGGRLWKRGRGHCSVYTCTTKEMQKKKKIVFTEWM